MERRITLSRNNGKDGLQSIVEFIALMSKIIDDVIAEKGIEKNLATVIGRGGHDCRRRTRLATNIGNLEQCLTAMKGAIEPGKMGRSNGRRAIEKIKSDAKMNKCVNQWNKTVNSLPNFGLPFIGAEQKPRKRTGGLTGEQVRRGICTLLCTGGLDDTVPTLKELAESKQNHGQRPEEPVVKMHPICTHSQGKHPCCIMSHDTLKSFVGAFLSPSSRVEDFYPNIDDMFKHLEKYRQNEKITYQRMWYLLFIHNIMWTCSMMTCPEQKEEEEEKKEEGE